MTGGDDPGQVATSMLRENLVDERLPALRDAGLLTPDTIKYLESYQRNYEQGAGTHYETGRPAAHYHNTEFYVSIVRPEIGAALSKAVERGNWSIISHALGMGSETGDVPFQEALTLENLMHGDEFRIFVFTGGQGGGKSYLAYVMAKYKIRLCQRDGIAAQAVTNSLSAVEKNKELEFIGSPQELLDYRLENPGHMVFVLDEASSFFDSKAGGHGTDLAKFVPFLRRLRKMKILPIIVSHRAMDIGTDIRNLESVVFVDKPSKERAVFYGESDGDELDDKMLDISGYSTDERYTYESDDLFISWKWDGLDEIVELMENPQKFKSLWEEKGVVKDLKGIARDIENAGDLESKRDDLIREVAHLEYSQSEIAEFAGVSPSRVSRLLSQDGDDDPDGDDSVGTNNTEELTDGDVAAENERILDELTDAQTEILRDAVQDELEDQ